VSASTVSKVIHGRTGVSAGTTFGFQATANGPFTVPTLSCTAN
jgi:hypothetical protein